MDIEYGTNQKPTVFISYNRASGYDLADTLQIELSTYADVKRDIKDIENWGSISEFMNTIREQDFVVLIITDAFMKSEGCLYEVMQLMKDKNWDQRVMYVVADDAHCIYDSVSQLNYLSYWESKAAELSNKLRNHKLGAISASIDNLKKIELIVLNIGEFMAKVRDSNNPKTEDAITAVIERVKKNNQVTDVSVIKSTEYFEDENRDVREKGNCLWIADEIREGWNFHSDIAWPIEMKARHVFGDRDRPYGKTYDSDSIENGQFAEVMIDVLRTKSGRRNDIIEIDEFARECSKLNGKKGYEIDPKIAQGLKDRFIELYKML